MNDGVTQRLAEAIAWCSVHADPADPDRSTRTPEFLPPLLAGEGVLSRVYNAGFAGVQQAVEFICQRRREALAQGGIHVAPESSDLAGGRVLSTDFTSDWCVIAQPESNGFFDADDLPGWDTWFHCARVGRSEFQVYCWVPPQLLEMAHNGIEVLPIPCLRWVDDPGEWRSAARRPWWARWLGASGGFV
ncbi:MAG TPA: hypothetical protein VGB24_00735 [Longimicrobium sp.]|jgi:hypothetical protein|uniref:hypothetical protein n=1 Tax=Longimicrobium sp. TaxID=2029185 RepID=UPI002EDB7D97